MILLKNNQTNIYQMIQSYSAVFEDLFVQLWRKNNVFIQFFSVNKNLIS